MLWLAGIVDSDALLVLSRQLLLMHCGLRE